MKKLFYKPDYGWAADAIPFYENGVYHIFYLLDYRDAENIGTPWYKATTKDFIHFEDKGEMLKRGSFKEYDMYVFTGSVIKDNNGKYHIFYTGHNTKMEEGQYLQAVMHAISDDLDHWTKIPEDTFTAFEGYEIRDWRDPYVFYDEKSKTYKMVLSTRKEGLPTRRRGTSALLESTDLKTWKVLDEPLYSPELYYAHECPDLFKIGDWYYHIFSEFSQYHVTRYVKSKSLQGPWIKPVNDIFDGRSFYAAKTVSDGKRRFLIGWNPTKEGNVDKGFWQWGGSLLTHELYQDSNGDLLVKMVDEIYNDFEEIKKYEYLNGPFGEKGKAKVTYFPLLNKDTCLLEVSFKLKADTERFGVLINADKESDSAYGYFVEPKQEKLIFELFPSFPQYAFNSVKLDKKISLDERKQHQMKIIIEDNMCVCYLDDTYALSSRMYDLSSDTLGIMSDGEIEISNISLKQLRKEG